MDTEELGKLVQDNEYNIKLVQYYEQIDNPQFNNKTDVAGVSTLHSIPGYRSLIELYIATHKEIPEELKNLSESLQKNIAYMTNYGVADEENNKNFAKQIYEDLEKTGDSFIYYSNFEGEHANFIKYSKEDGKYYRTFYNAGAVAGDDHNNINQEDKQHLIKHRDILRNIIPQYSALEYPIIEDYVIEKVILEDIKESKLSKAKKISNKEVADNNKLRLHSPSPTSKIVVNSQKFGNCSTRSIRELLRDNLPAPTFKDLYDFITNTPYSEMLKNAGLGELGNLEIIKIGTSLNEQLKKLDEKNAELDKKTKTHAEIMKIYGEMQKMREENTLIAFLLINLEKGGYNSSTKQYLLLDIAEKFASKNKLDEKLTQDLWRKLFVASITDIDLSIPTNMLPPVEKNLLKSIKEHKNLNENNVDNILKTWQNKCIEDPKIELMIKAPIIKGMMDEVEELQNSSQKYTNSTKVIDIYMNLLSKQKLETEKNKKVLSQAPFINSSYGMSLAKEIVRNIGKPTMKQSMKENYPKAKAVLEENFPAERLQNLQKGVYTSVDKNTMPIMDMEEFKKYSKIDGKRQMAAKSSKKDLSR